jgi:phosphoribosylformimino-5-aminoimidazole carboxamide ribotide isomerase
MTFTVYPAIDLRKGQVVRLQQGDPKQQTTYTSDPLAVAMRWQHAGSRWVHVVNLDGAFGDDTAGSANQRAIQHIAQHSGLQVQFGGGIRAISDIRAAFSTGVARVVIGTAAVENPALVKMAIDEFGSERIVVGLDSRDGMIVTRGWQTESNIKAIDLGVRFADMGAKYALYTEVKNDGMMRGVAAEMTAALAQLTGLRVIASGGVRHIDDVRELMLYSMRGVCGVVVGKALYENKLDLSAALALV